MGSSHLFQHKYWSMLCIETNLSRMLNAIRVRDAGSRTNDSLTPQCELSSSRPDEFRDVGQPREFFFV